MTDTITITTRIRGLTGEAECSAGGRAFYSSDRTQAAALSDLCSQMAKVKDLIGARWVVPDCGLSGVIGETAKRRRSGLKEHPDFELLGDRMND